MPDDLLKEAVPGNIRKAEHFVAFLKRFVEYLKVYLHCYYDTLATDPFPQTRMRVLHVVAETPLSFLQHLKDITFIERRPLRYAAMHIYIHDTIASSHRPEGFAQRDYNLLCAPWS